MASPQVIDLETLLAPISEDAPAGVDPRSDTSPNSLYYRVKDARNAARAAERSAVEIGGPMPEEWEDVIDAAIEVLTGHAKDLEIAAWMTEGLVRRDGFAGLRDGLKAIKGIVVAFWDPCFPVIDEEDGIEGKVSAISGLSGSGAVGTLIQPIRLTPLTRGSQWNFSHWNYEQANELEKVTDPTRRQERIDNGAVTMEQFRQSVAETSSAHFQEISETLDECLDALAEMSSTFDTVAGSDAPSTSGLRDMLEEVRSAVRHFAADKLAAGGLVSGGAETALPDFASEASEAAPGEGSAVVRRINGYATREDALAELTRIAGYFRNTEPHSPISYTLEDAVRRARLTLPELLAELAEDPAHIQRILMAAGIKPQEDQSGASGY
ncbi:type VI secretion system protein TssA [Mesorhizobium sp. 1B3]|uniref:type VI secretion system protein TssA n=1 Tax=Mesorhizobium sp. 1B3 TaxID=3243599 RepID=UPI003D97C394